MSGIGFGGAGIGFIPGGPGAGAAPTGPAGGDLAGSYPNPLAAKLQGHPVSAAAPTTGDLLVWTGTTWVPTPPPLFGTEFAGISTVVPATTTNAPGSAVTYTSLGSALSPIPLDPAGVYAITVFFFVSVSMGNTEFFVDVRVGGGATSIGASVERLAVAGGTAARTSFVSATTAQLPPGPFWMDIVFAKRAGTGSVTLVTASLNVWRLS